ncbi:hypothetical protein LCGC14_2358020 [marine sediment metagenome]|uniref:Uncharacterized protein n=1 Tax=marine sediment metagenome TaxID=412755 RepID=A0A0F9C7M8_9ZZZZ
MTGGLEYSLTLETGEEVEILELDPETCPELRSEDVRSAASHVLGRCTYTPRDVLEEAKGGFCKRLQELLRTPPIGCLLTVSNPECSELETCGIADRSLCTLRYVSKSGGKFPICWEAGPSKPCPDDIGMQVRDLAGRVAHAWREGRYVIIVSPALAS